MRSLFSSKRRAGTDLPTRLAVEEDRFGRRGSSSSAYGAFAADDLDRPMPPAANSYAASGAAGKTGSGVRNALISMHAQRVGERESSGGSRGSSKEEPLHNRKSQIPNIMDSVYSGSRTGAGGVSAPSGSRYASRGTRAGQPGLPPTGATSGLAAAGGSRRGTPPEHDVGVVDPGSGSSSAYNVRSAYYDRDIAARMRHVDPNVLNLLSDKSSSANTRRLREHEEKISSASSSRRGSRTIDPRDQQLLQRQQAEDAHERQLREIYERQQERDQIHRQRIAASIRDSNPYEVELPSSSTKIVKPHLLSSGDPHTDSTRSTTSSSTRGGGGDHITASASSSAASRFRESQLRQPTNYRAGGAEQMEQQYNTSSSASSSIATRPGMMRSSLGGAHPGVGQHREAEHRMAASSGYDSNNSGSGEIAASSSSSRSPFTNWSRTMIGLRNLGNTCFLNSSIQCLLSIPQLQAYFRERFTDGDLNDRTAPLKGRLAREFHALLSDVHQSRAGAVLSPAGLRNLLIRHAPQFSGYQQQDSHEALRFLLDGLHEDLNRVRAKPKYQEMKDIKGESVDDAALRWWNYSMSHGNSPMTDIFGGQLMSETRCGTCGHKSWTFDVFLDLSLPIPHVRTDQVDLLDCFRSFTAVETLDADYKCENCKNRKNMSKRLTIYKPPRVMVVHMKRFSHSRFSREKLNTLVRFPTKQMDITEFCEAATATRGQYVYDLAAVSQHSGSMGGGHYTAACRINGTDWASISDSSAQLMSERSVEGDRSAYVLFYVRRK
ncbi:unnamed protein product [Amoebophrya sp. A120]|nr:unnamed protein product [Amoebophrya sp. A120]|eukprot:GSA120T00011129001.1